jgi:hypothetical protein
VFANPTLLVFTWIHCALAAISTLVLLWAVRNASDFRQRSAFLIAAFLSAFYTLYYGLDAIEYDTISRTFVRGLGLLAWPLVWMALPIESILGQRRDARRILERASEITNPQVEED